MLRLIKPDMRYFTSYVYFCEQYKEKKVTHYFVEEKEQLLAMRERLLVVYQKEELGVDLKPGYVTCSRFWLVEDEEVVGVSSIRHGLTDGLERIGGHIGYGIRPDKFNQGYGTAQLQFLLAEAAKMGIRNALITCDVNNIGSRRVMEKNGGVLVDVVDNSSEGNTLLTNRLLLDTGYRNSSAAEVATLSEEQHLSFEKMVYLSDGEVAIGFEKTVEDSTCISHYYSVQNQSGDEVGLMILRFGSEDSLYVDGNIGYYIYEKYRGHRYTTKSCALILQMVKQSGLRRLFITCDLDNQASIAVCEGLGARYQELFLYVENGKKKLRRRYTLAL